MEPEATVNETVEETSEEPLTAGEEAREFLLDVLDAMEIESDVTFEQTEDSTWRLEVVGDDAGEIIGRYGHGLNALQYLTVLVTQKRTGEHLRITLDADGYRAKREAALVEQARELAAEVAQAGQEAELDPLSAFERRIIHNALMDHPDVVTYSEGVEPERRVVIAPRPKR
jgi:spoIIIJ-associated protein